MQLGVHVDREVCRATGQCVYSAPGVFVQDGEGISTVVNPRGDPIPKIVEATNSCIPGAISLTIDGVEVRTWLAEDWQEGALVDSRLVSLLEARNEEHEELRQALKDVLGAMSGAHDLAHLDPGCPGRDLRPIFERVSAHLALEEHLVFDDIGALVDEHLVDAFRRGHDQVAEHLRTAVARGDEMPDLATVADLVAAVEEQVTMEEDILFRVVLGALAHQREQ